VLRPYSFGDDAIATPASATSNDLASVGPLNAVVRSAPAAELTLLRILQDQRCLAEAMYYEARGEGREGQEAIAEVVFHRMKSPGYPHSICGVVYQGAERGHGCQFSFACDGELQLPKSSGAWSRARLLAAKIMAGAVHLGDITGDAISFHASEIQPDWADTMERTIQIGNHVFYRSAARSKSS
jgi:spore germination cell wall hydrolase CwlJ-like protein